MKKPSKELLWRYLDESIVILVSKKRGVGFLLQPYGHHNNAELNNAVWSVEGTNHCDIFGLDGNLTICVGIFEEQDPKRKFATEILEALSLHYGWPHREVSLRDYWDNHPLFDSVNYI